ncbi:MAG TPA: NTP transferase domain-containing protein, partial [Rubrivivax sp.]|nr:NTP transferase domain-containing protein [Rubrivivax sp.]
MAAGKGTRMKSTRPKVLHTLAGRSLLQHVLDATAPLEGMRQVIVTGHGAELVEQAARGPRLEFARQEPQLGTGHAMQQAAPLLADDGTTLILNGDVPLIETGTLTALVAACADKRLALLTARLDDPSGYGRIVRSTDGPFVQAIVEHKDATDAQRALREVYAGVMAAPTAALKQWLARL